VVKIEVVVVEIVLSWSAMDETSSCAEYDDDNDDEGSVEDMLLDSFDMDADGE
jgi:hypothetical protein